MDITGFILHTIAITSYYNVVFKDNHEVFINIFRMLKMIRYFKLNKTIQPLMGNVLKSLILTSFQNCEKIHHKYNTCKCSFFYIYLNKITQIWLILFSSVWACFIARYFYVSKQLDTETDCELNSRIATCFKGMEISAIFTAYVNCKKRRCMSVCIFSPLWDPWFCMLMVSNRLHIIKMCNPVKSHLFKCCKWCTQVLFSTTFLWPDV